MFGANWNNGSNAGLFYWNLNNTSGNANVNIGGRTLIRDGYEIFASYIPHLLVKIRP
jgi:hypothetical protein